jgi:GT2 family glycosyltransferase
MSDNVNEIFPLISVVIINHNGKDYIKECLETVFKTNYPNFEVILVDNASTDGSLTLIMELFGSYPCLKIVYNTKNIGLAGGRNVGAKYSKGKYIVFLDHDTKVDPNWLKELVTVMEEDPSIGAAQCKFLLMDDPKRFDSAGHYIDYFGIGTIIGFMEYDRGQHDYIYEILGAQGGAFAVKRKIFEEVGGADEDFFYLFEETDLCWRIWLAGYKVVFVPKSIVYHKGGGTARRIGSERITYLFVRNRITSMIKNYSLLSLLKYLPIHIIIMLGFSFIMIKKHRFKEARAIINAITWNILNLHKIWWKRRKVQKMRKITDNFLFKRGVIKKPDLRGILNRVHSL